MPPSRFETLRYPLSGAAVFFLEEGRGGPKPAEGTHTSGHADTSCRIVCGQPAAERRGSTSGPAGREDAAFRPGAAAGCSGFTRSRKFKIQDSKLNDPAGHAWLAFRFGLQPAARTTSCEVDSCCKTSPQPSGRAARTDLRDAKLQPSARGRLRAAAASQEAANSKFKIKIK